MDKLKCSTVKISDAGISELDGASDLIFIPKDQIKSITLFYGCGVQRPIIQTLLSILLISVPTYLCIPPLFACLNTSEPCGGKLLFIFIMPLIFVFFGIWMFIEVFKNNYYFKVKSENNIKKIVFKERPTEISLAQFINQARQYYGYIIESEVKEIPHNH
jgi:hypothetical protein